MAINPKDQDNIQVYRGALPALDVFAQNSGAGCCAPGGNPTYDKLGTVVHFDNALAHLNPSGANDKFRLSPSTNGTQADVVAHINAVGVGAQISVLVVPTYAFMRLVGVHIAAEEAGLTFNLTTRNGLTLPEAGGDGEDNAFQVAAASGATTCDPLVRTSSAGSFLGFGALGNNEFIDIFGQFPVGSADCFTLDAEELILEVASMPASGVVSGTFDITVSANYDIALRAAR